MGSLENQVIIVKLLSYIPDFEFTTLEDGLKETIDWFIKNYDNCRK